MIALDTNLLVRYFVEPDSALGQAASQLLESGLSQANPGFVSPIIIAEMLWVLRTSYVVPLAVQHEIVRELLDMPQIVIEQSDAVERALTLPHRDLADCILHEIGQAAGCSQTATFDKRFAKLNRVELVT